jgi:Ser/Thr protein kinase RdoA (MazF antagonist)
MDETADDLKQAQAAAANWRGLLGPAPVLRPWPGGLVNRTYGVGRPPQYALQSVAPQFGPEVDARMARIAAPLAAAGIACPVPLADDTGQLSPPGAGGRHWRLCRWIDGDVWATAPDPTYLGTAGALLARFHDALFNAGASDFPDSGFHDTGRYMARLAGLRADGDDEVRRLAEAILDCWHDWSGAAPPAPGMRPGHGDPKLGNFVFATGRADAIGLIDLDTAGLYRLDDELGDAIRSCCNLASEDRRQARLDRERFRALVGGYVTTSTTATADEKAAIVHGAGRIALELAARFATDAMEQSYFGWDPAIAPDARTHNLWRAEGQLDLARQIIAARGELEAIVTAI